MYSFNVLSIFLNVIKNIRQLNIIIYKFMNKIMNYRINKILFALLSCKIY
jgi:hypothetical protein